MQLTGAHETAVLCMLVAYALFISYAAGCPPVLLLATKMILEKGMAWKGEEKKDNLTLVAFVLLYGLGHVQVNIQGTLVKGMISEHECKNSSKH